ncbi:MAG: tRNA lysidine(34) synthetase TilS [Acidobacteria bacterium]|nr:tRNA lysidine(34) synthetase TilS [Acidobacteriota bacterium]
MLERIVQITSRYNMFGPLHRSGPARRVGVAVSGGVDSVSLLHALLQLRETLHIELSVVHVNHKLRGAESDADEQFTRDLAASLGLPLHCTALGALSGNIEQSARLARISFFHSLIVSGVVDRIATGHTASDQAETVLFRFLRGSGSTGLSGILPVTQEGIVRPLLEVTREQVECFARERGIAWRIDGTNASLNFRRNRIRHELLPRLQNDYNPRLPEQLAHVAEIAREEEAYWRSQIEPLAASTFRTWGDSLLVDCTQLSALAVAAQRRLLRLAFTRVKCDLHQIGFHHIEQVRHIAQRSQGHGRAHIPGLDVVRSFGWLRISNSPLPPPPSVYVPLCVPGITRLPGGECVAVDKFTAPESGYNGYGNEALLLEPDHRSGPLVLRYWQPGDLYQPVGFSRPEKVKQMFQLARIPLWERRFWPIIENGRGILWCRRFGCSLAAREEIVQAIKDRGEELVLWKLVEV